MEFKNPCRVSVPPSEKNNGWGDLKNSYHRFLSWGGEELTMFPIIKDFWKWKMAFRAQFHMLILVLHLALHNNWL